MTGLHTEISGVYDITVVRFTASHADREVLRALCTRALETTRGADALATIGRLISALETPP